MERLTERYKDSIANTVLIRKCGDKLCKDICDDIECNCSKCELEKVLEKLATYEDLEEQGLLVRLPCKVGTEVFCFFPGDSHYTKCQIKKMEICSSIFGNICYFAEPVGQRGCCCRYFDNEFGKFLFFTRKEAEKKLEEVKKWSQEKH